MSLMSGTFYYAVCDECGERVQLSDETGYMVGESLREVNDHIMDSGGAILADGYVRCAACCEERAAEQRRKESS